MIGKILVPILFCLGAVCIACSLAYGQTVPDPISDPSGFFTALISGFTARDWLLVGGFAVCGLTALARWQRVRLASWLPFLGTKLGGYLLAFGFAMLYAVGVGLVKRLEAVEIVKVAILDGLAAGTVWEIAKDVKR